ncbi:MAG: SPOR domain-containing protein [Nitrospinae bacterium]|nr:SPOR domain-containing protein [Nitrospinota bacterium]
MKEFNLLKEEHGIRAKLSELNFHPERRMDRKIIFIPLLLIAVTFLFSRIYPLLEFGISTGDNPEDTEIPHDKPAVVNHDIILKSEVLSHKSETPLISRGSEKSERDPERSPDRIPLVVYPQKKDETPPLQVAQDQVKKERQMAQNESKEGKVIRGDEKKFIIRVATCVYRGSADIIQRDLQKKGFASYLNISPGSIRSYAVSFHGLHGEVVEKVMERFKKNGIHYKVKKEEKGEYTVITDSYYLQREADKILELVADMGIKGDIIKEGKVTTLYRVYVGDYNNRSEASSIVDKLKSYGFSTILEERGKIKIHG